EWRLFQSLAGNVDLWLGCSLLGLTEFVLVGIQVCLWMCRCRKELPEVPSLRRRNYVANVDKKSDSDNAVSGGGSASNSGSLRAIQAVDDPCDAYAPKNFPNCIGENALTRREVNATTAMRLELYDPMHGFELVNPIVAQTSEHASHFTNV
ncbi:hypothetical protein AAVH_34390, partial [Aphelenchoides avenae]